VNYVSVWLASGVLLAGVGMRTVLARVERYARFSAVRISDAHLMSHHFSRTRLQIALAVVFAVVFLVASHGSASRTFAASVNYTYHMRLSSIASDGVY